MVEILTGGFVDKNWSFIDMGTDKIRMWKYYYPDGKESGLEIIYLGGIFRVWRNPNELDENTTNVILGYFKLNEDIVILE